MSLAPTSADAAAAPSAAALARLEEILTKAYGVAGGHEELNAVIVPAIGLDLFQDVATDRIVMRHAVHALREALEERGPPVIRQCVEAFYVALPGNAELRAWVAEHQPGSAARVGTEAFEAAQQRAAIRGLEALNDARGQGFVDREIARFREKLEDASRQLQRLRGYKQLHDDLHQIQTKALPTFTRILLRPALDEYDKEEVRSLARLLAGSVPDSRKCIDERLDEAVRAEELAWLPDLQAAVTRLGEGDLGDAGTLRTAAYELRGVLRVHLPRLNRLLANAARAIPFDDIADFLRVAARRAPAESPLIAKLDEAADAVGEIAGRLAGKVAVHDGWQDVDTALWAMEPVVRTARDPDSRIELAGIWKNAQGRIAAVEKIDAERVATFRQAAEGFREALAETDAEPIRLAIAFQDYAGMVRQQFFMVDHELLAQCAAVAELEPRLRKLIEGGD